MMFVQSLKGISHNKIEDTKEEHLGMSVMALRPFGVQTMIGFSRSPKGAQCSNDLQEGNATYELSFTKSSSGKP